MPIEIELYFWNEKIEKYIFNGAWKNISSVEASIVITFCCKKPKLKEVAILCFPVQTLILIIYFCEKNVSVSMILCMVTIIKEK